MQRQFGLMPKTQYPEKKRELTPDEVSYLEGEVKLYTRWRRFYTIMAVPGFPVGVVAGVGAIYSLATGFPMQNFIVGMVISIFGFSPLYLRIAMRDRAREISEILETYPRTDGESGAGIEPDEDAPGTDASTDDGTDAATVLEADLEDPRD